MENKPKKIRLDQLLVDLGLVENQSKAKARIMAGDVLVNEQRVDKPGSKYLPTINIRIKNNSHPFVSRGGLKLQKALNCWPIDVTGLVCLDVGASTGGFTEVLLLHGAKKVFAIDVGYGQLAEKLRRDVRVVNMERTHILTLEKKSIKEPAHVAVVDVSFISLSRVLPKVVSLLDKPFTIYALIKPQFEAGVEYVEKGGIVRDEKVHEQCISKVSQLAIDLGLKVLGVEKSPILGAKGNVEFLIALASILSNKVDQDGD